MTKAAESKMFVPSTRLVIIVGNYGSGKTEISVNLAISQALSGKKVQLADLDIVNPYFRSREAHKLMQAHGIRVVMPPGAQQFADLPIILPEIKGMLAPAGDDVSIFDVGGDDVGAKMLSSMVEALGDKPYSLLQVINSRRPFTDTVEACVRMKEKIELSSRLKVTGYIANSHLIDETSEEVILEGYELAGRLSEQTGVPLEFVAVMEELISGERLSTLEVPILTLKRNMLPPWLQREAKNDNSGEGEEILPAARMKPIGQP